MIESFEIEGIGNYYGCLNVKMENGRFYWGIENYDGIEWDEIPESLYLELKAHHQRGQANE